jgi:hypothetical protein
MSSLTGAAALRQQWGLFLVNKPFTFRIQVEARDRPGHWVLIYRSHMEDALKLAPTLTYRRLRAIYNPSVSHGPSAQYEGFVRWLGERVLREHPEYDALRVSMERFAIASRTFDNQSLSKDHFVEYVRQAVTP